MTYFRSIAIIFCMSIFAVIATLYFTNITRAIEKENKLLTKKIKITEDQININEIEFSLYNSYDYLKKMQKIYFHTDESVNINKIISYKDFQNNHIENVYTVGTK